jgi:hypothetical protein
MLLARSLSGTRSSATSRGPRYGNWDDNPERPPVGTRFGLWAASRCLG